MKRNKYIPLSKKAQYSSFPQTCQNMFIEWHFEFFLFFKYPLRKNYQTNNSGVKKVNNQRQDHSCTSVSWPLRDTAQLCCHFSCDSIFLLYNLCILGISTIVRVPAGKKHPWCYRSHLPLTQMQLCWVHCSKKVNCVSRRISVLLLKGLWLYRMAVSYFFYNTPQEDPRCLGKG